MSQAGGNARRSGRGLGGFLLLFGLILVLELFLDVVLLPADEVLIPAELIGDALLLAGMVGGSVLASRGGAPSGRRRGGSTRPAMRGNRRATLGANRRGVSGLGLGLVLGAWLFLAGILLFQWWFSIHHPILTVLFLPFEILFDLVVLVIVVVFTLMGLSGGRSGSSAGREVGG